jgi:hypothetical protein
MGVLGFGQRLSNGFCLFSPEYFRAQQSIVGHEFVDMLPVIGGF